MPEVPPQFRSAICRVSSSAGEATGYFVGPRRVVTTARAVTGAAAIAVTAGGESCHASLAAEDEDFDVALLEVEPSREVQPLALEEIESRVAFVGYGFTESGTSLLTFRGLILDPLVSDERGQTRLKLFCERGEAEDFEPLPGSPILVDGAVVGQWSHPLGDDGVARYGVGFATPVAALRRLGVSPRGRKVGATPLASNDGPIGTLPEGHYHVFISYDAADRPTAVEVAELLEGAGLRVFLDQKELKLGEFLPASLEQELAHSQSAVVLVSKGWLKSAWCLKEANVLKQRAIEQPGFRLFPMRVDDSELPLFLADLMWLDGRQAEDLGVEVNQLIAALSGTEDSHTQTMSAVNRAEAQVLDLFRATLRGAPDAQRLLRIVADWEAYGSPNRTVLIQVAERLVGLNCYQQALDVLRRAGRGRRAEQLRALALDKLEATDEAMAILERLYQSGDREPETLGILAGIYRRSAHTTQNPAHRGRALALYREGWQTRCDTYNGINCAQLLLADGEFAEAQKLVRQILEALAERKEADLDHWQLATVAEAHLINRDLELARAWYRKAVAREPALIQDIAVMGVQAARDLEALGRDPGALADVLPIPQVIAFTGHMEDAKGRPHKRFPPGKVDEVRRAIAARLAKIPSVYAFCSAARGADLIFLEEVLRKDGHAKVTLPFRVEDYKRLSVGGYWDEKFDELVKHPRVELVAPPEAAPADLEGQQEAFARANRQVCREASKFAKGLGQRPRMLAVWDGEAGDGRGGTADSVAYWQGEGNEVDIVDMHDPLGRHKVVEPRRVAVGIALVLVLAAALTALAWQTDVLVPVQQARGVALIGADVQQAIGFDVKDSAGLFVGIRQFSHYPVVPYAVDDAVDLAHLFALELKLINSENVLLALSGEPQKWSSRKRLQRLKASGVQISEPTYTGILSQLQRIPASAGPRGLLVLAFATHGFARDGNHYLVMADSAPGDDIVRSGIPVSRLLDEASLAKGHRSVLFLDACQERVVRRGLTERMPSTGALYAALAHASGIAVLAATQLGGYSYDDDKAMNGVFTKAVIDGLGGEARPPAGATETDREFITIRLLGDYVHERVKKWIATNRPQDVTISRGIERRILGDAADLPLAVVK